MIWVLLAGLNSCVGNLLVKASQANAAAGAGFIERLFSLAFIGGLAFYGINVVLFAKALETLPVSVGYPMLAGSGFAALTLAAAVLFGEAITLTKLAGLGCVLLGIVLLARAG
jgi:multidrug transporter EmrE-like cation transporter